MKKILLVLLLAALLPVSSYGAEKSLEANLDAIEEKFNDLLRKEAEQKNALKAQKVQLESEVEELKSKEEG